MIAETVLDRETAFVAEDPLPNFPLRPRLVLVGVAGVKDGVAAVEDQFRPVKVRVNMAQTRRQAPAAGAVGMNMDIGKVCNAQ
jgi:hypothetical protein